MEKSLNSSSSARKKLLQYEQDIKRDESQSGYLGRTLSRQHSKFMESILREGLQKQQTDRVLKKQSSTKGYHSQLNKTPSSNSKKLDLQLSSLNTTKFKPLLTSKSNKYNSEIRIQNNDENSSVANEANRDNQTIPQFFNDTDEIRSARQNQLMQVKRIKFEFSFLSYLIEVGLAYGLFIGILYLIQAGSFPYFEVILIFALTLTIRPWKISTLIFLFSSLPITIVNHYTGLSLLTYIQILICYLGVLVFNQRHKIKIIFILVLVVQIVFGFMILPSLYKIMSFKQEIYFYLFPLFVFILRSLIQLGLWIVGYTQALFLQIPLFLIGLQYGTILSVSTGDIQFWYLIVFFTLQVMNERTHFFLKVMINLVKFCFPKMKTTPTPDATKKNNHILSAHWNGYSSINSFHLVGCVYIFTQLPLYASPYSSSFRLSDYTKNGQWYKPLVIWALISVYEIMCLILQRNKQNVLLIGYTNNRWYTTIGRAWMLVLGLWIFYMGLGIGQYCIPNSIITTV